MNAVSFRTSSFRTSSSNGRAIIKGNRPITIDELRVRIPSVFADGKSGKTSDRYTYIPTVAVVERLIADGYGVFSAMQSGTRDEARRGHTKHLLRFRQVDAMPLVDGTYPEIVLLNSHDGTSAYRLMAGLFRMVCSNGMVVCSSCVEDVRVRHSGNVVSDVADGVQRIRYQLPSVTDAIRDMQSIELTRDEQGVFALAALRAKYGDDVPPVEPLAIIQPRRAEDVGNDLWRVLNRTQEALITGGDRYTTTPTETRRRRRMHTRPVNSVGGNATLNAAIWQLGEEMRRLKTANA